MNLFNLHTHSNFSDGSEPPEYYVKQALDYGFKSLGFSDHVPLPFENHFAIPENKYLEYANEIRSLQMKYKDQIEIYLSLEFDFIPGVLDDFSFYKDQIKPDYVIGSVHLVKNPDKEKLWFTDGHLQATFDKGLKEVYDNDIRKAVTAFYHQNNQMIETQKPDIIGHMDKVKMHNNDRHFTASVETREVSTGVDSNGQHQIGWTYRTVE